MKPFEVLYTILRPILPTLPNQVHRELETIIKNCPVLKPKLLDIGGRKSHYTIGLPAIITVTDVPRETVLQHQLGLGINEATIQQTLERRSNIDRIVYDNMEHTTLPVDTYDIAVAVEVLEHVERDDEFLTNVCNVLKPGGIFFMTTPNGDYKTVVTNPDHKRHYTRDALTYKLSRHFDEIEVFYAVCGCRFRRWGLKAWSIKHPFSTIIGAFSNVICQWKTFKPKVKYQAHGTHHLVAIARKPLE